MAAPEPAVPAVSGRPALRAGLAVSGRPALRAGATRRDPVALLWAAGLLLALRIGMAVWEHLHPVAALPGDAHLPAVMQDAERRPAGRR